MRVIIVEFDIRDFTPGQVTECKREYTETLEKVAKQGKTFATENSETVVKMLAILGMIEAWETGGILGYTAYNKENNIYVKTKELLN